MKDCVILFSASEVPNTILVISASGSVGGVQPCQGWGRGFESRLALFIILKIKSLILVIENQSKACFFTPFHSSILYDILIHRSVVLLPATSLLTIKDTENYMIKSKSIKQRVFEIIQIGSREDVPSRIGDFIIVASILLNILVLFLGTFEELKRYFGLFKVIETTTIIIFSVEYVLRIWTAEYIYTDVGKMRARFKFFISPEGIIDLLTILPFFFLYGFAAFRMLRVVRIFHLFRLNVNYDSFNVITSVLLEKKNQILSSVFIIVVLMLASSLFIYGAEHDAQPLAFKNAFSGIWWSLSTIFTVGYGDIYPITAVGKIMGVIITFLGVGSVAIPTGIISAGFVENYTEMQRNRLSEAKNKTTGSITIEKKSEDVGKLINELEKKYGVDIVVILRDGVMVMAEDKVRAKAEDILIYRDIV